MLKKKNQQKSILTKVCCVTFWSPSLCTNMKIRFDAGSHPVKRLENMINYCISSLRRNIKWFKDVLKFILMKLHQTVNSYHSTNTRFYAV